MTTIETLLHASVEIAKQRQLIATLIQENELLRQRLSDRGDFTAERAVRNHSMSSQDRIDAFEAAVGFTSAPALHSQ